MRVQSEQRCQCSVLVRERRRSSGFTLVELMVVIVIIALLVGLIMPAIFGAITTARIAEVRTEISQLDAGISSFKTEFGGVAPPSSITFPDITDLTLPADAATAVARWNSNARSKAIIRRIWPQFDFGSNGGNQGLRGSLDGSECLVFFLGGVSNGNTLVGFSKNPATPLDPNATNRVGPFFEFDNGRLTSPGASGNTAAPEYKDTLPSQTNPYVYFSSNDGRGYNSADSAFTNIYIQPGGTTAYKPQSHQIISPGADTEYGDGGIYDPDDESTVSEAERDNITNFSSGKLVP